MFSNCMQIYCECGDNYCAKPNCMDAGSTHMEKCSSAHKSEDEEEEEEEEERLVKPCRGG